MIIIRLVISLYWQIFFIWHVFFYYIGFICPVQLKSLKNWYMAIKFPSKVSLLISKKELKCLLENTLTISLEVLGSTRSWDPALKPIDLQ